MKRHPAAATFLVIVVALAGASAILQKKATAAAVTVGSASFEVDPMWPKPLPNHWVARMGDRGDGRRPGSCVDRPSGEQALSR